MPLPDFTDDERYLINYVKSPNASDGAISYVWGYLLGGAALSGFGAYYGSIPMMLTAFVVICGFRIYEERFQTKWTPLWRSIIVKFEASSIDHVDDVESDDKPLS